MPGCGDAARSRHETGKSCNHNADDASLFVAGGRLCGGAYLLWANPSAPQDSDDTGLGERWTDWMHLDGRPYAEEDSASCNTCGGLDFESMTASQRRWGLSLPHVTQEALRRQGLGARLGRTGLSLRARRLCLLVTRHLYGQSTRNRCPRCQPRASHSGSGLRFPRNRGPCHLWRPF